MLNFLINLYKLNHLNYLVRPELRILYSSKPTQFPILNRCTFPKIYKKFSSCFHFYFFSKSQKQVPHKINFYYFSTALLKMERSWMENDAKQHRSMGGYREISTSIWNYFAVLGLWLIDVSCHAQHSWRFFRVIEFWVLHHQIDDKRRKRLK